MSDPLDQYFHNNAESARFNGLELVAVLSHEQWDDLKTHLHRVGIVDYQIEMVTDEWVRLYAPKEQVNPIQAIYKEKLEQSNGEAYLIAIALVLMAWLYFIVF